MSQRQGSPRTAFALPPFKPRKKLFIGLMLVLAAWVGVLLWLYVTTVWPMRHSLTTTHPVAA